MVPRIHAIVLGCGYFHGGDYVIANGAALLWGGAAEETERTAD